MQREQPQSVLALVQAPVEQRAETEFVVRSVAKAEDVVKLFFARSRSTHDLVLCRLSLACDIGCIEALSECARLRNTSHSTTSTQSRHA